MVPNWKIQSSHARPAEQLTRNDNQLWQLWSGCHLFNSWHLHWSDQWIYLVLQRYATVACWINFRSSGSVHITVISNTSNTANSKSMLLFICNFNRASSYRVSHTILISSSIHPMNMHFEHFHIWTFSWSTMLQNDQKRKKEPLW